ncbi:zinc-binding dehydrogenase [Alteraurantiacibacter buctensis]|uniref:Zinc-binding dehydrogenase n=1 Tax=Alteraurantiacibacter buctensis TaxID=1503981 RepID=A0A844YZN9_9SPHN|nr:zinc-binding dehydrogenase [Alteraurantiacibacter buctensis]MXO72662.1 zinc-binding dehydrogenase [Alteraurantiacibacter buctensis]
MTTTGRQLRSTLADDGVLTLELVTQDFPQPTGNMVLVRMEAAPINPSDLFLLTAGADLANAEYTPGKVVARLHPQAAAAQKARMGQSLPVGNEGAGTVIATGETDMARALMGQRVACVPGHAYGEYALCDAAMCLPLGDHTAEEGASSFVNPMTALGFAETARMGGHKALVHAAAASNLGQMLVRICKEDGLGLVNIVRKPEQAELLRKLGAEYVVDSSQPDFEAALAAAIAATDAFIGFDPIGGGTTTDTCLRAMERVAASRLTTFNRYGSSHPKVMYIYGRLDTGPTILTPSYGFGWSVGGWLLTPFLEAAGPEVIGRMRTRVRAGLTTTFASNYKHKVSLDGMLTKAAMTDYARMATGEKYLVTM